MATVPDLDEPARDAVRRWAASGAMALTGWPDGPALGPPSGLIGGLDRLAAPFPGLDPLALITERAAAARLRRGGRTSCGGGTRLLPTADGWLAVSLPRPDDVDLVPAWLAGSTTSPVLGSGDGRPPWDQVAGVVRHEPAAELEARAVGLGLAVGRLGAGASARPAVLERPLGAADGHLDPRGAVVVDLSSLWAGPLCGALLAEAGATVVKVESRARPDGARSGPPEVFERLNGSKRSVALDLATADGVDLLRRLVAHADVVIESSRPRALRHLGIDAARTGPDGPRVWVSITGHGREGDPGRVAFGDDAAVAGGLVVDDGTGPLFCADAIADPCAGLAAAGAVLATLGRGGRWLLDVSMVAVAAGLAGPTLPVPHDLADLADLADRPSPSPPSTAAAAALGADTAAVLSQLLGSA